MATIIKTIVPSMTHKRDHKCFKLSPSFVEPLSGFKLSSSFVEGLLGLENYCLTCGEKLVEEGESEHFECSECGKTLMGNLFKYNYCPNCGVKFD